MKATRSASRAARTSRKKRAKQRQLSEKSVGTDTSGESGILCDSIHWLISPSEHPVSRPAPATLAVPVASSVCCYLIRYESNLTYISKQDDERYQTAHDGSGSSDMESESPPFGVNPTRQLTFYLWAQLKTVRICFYMIYRRYSNIYLLCSAGRRH